jgi:hypothetical protein
MSARGSSIDSARRAPAAHVLKSLFDSSVDPARSAPVRAREPQGLRSIPTVGPPGPTRSTVRRIAESQGWVSVSVAPLAVASWRAVRLAEHRWPACRCSRDRRPSGCDSAARDRLAALPQRHRSGVGGRLTRTRLPRVCQLQRPCSLPTCSCFRGQLCDSRRLEHFAPIPAARGRPPYDWTSS